ncbi:hypothetical protein [Paraglaciecola polaris]|uniref:Uncharacterized protein n=1 Tax=Paraglaciecola polaris LMG 21857 TaxID=1129793 RepID=K6ZEL2_9ALTE|nr:hypothetical protein [Paraglaciecola polaris]GAC34526.1 hypothetical protein GPLA_3638 [Paraglaciecola polaris LMG 21857]
MEVNSTGANQVQSNQPTPRQEVERRATPVQETQTAQAIPQPTSQAAEPAQASDPNQRVGSIVDVQV